MPPEGYGARIYYGQEELKGLSLPTLCALHGIPADLFRAEGGNYSSSGSMAEQWAARNGLKIKPLVAGASGCGERTKEVI